MKRIAADVLIFAALGALGVSAGVTLFGFGLRHAGAMVAVPADVRCCRDCGPVCHCDPLLGCHCPRPTD